MKQYIGTLITLGLLSPGAAWAVKQPEHMRGRSSFEVAQGAATRVQRRVAHEPAWQDDTPAWSAFLHREGGTWRTIWDAETRVPLSIYGSGISAPGATDSGDAAEGYAWSVLGRHLDLLAPGAREGDFAVASNRVQRGVRTVVLRQLHGGLTVLGGSVSFTFKRDRLITIGSTALPHVDAPALAAAATDSRAAEARALAWIREDALGDDVRVVSVGEFVVVPLIRPAKTGAAISYATARVVTVATKQNPGLWRVYLDAAGGEPVAREQLLRYGAGTVKYDTPVRWPGGTRYDAPALHAQLTVEGAQQVTGVDGAITWNGTANAALTARVRGPYVVVANQAGADATVSGSIPDNGTATWRLAGDEFGDAQLTMFIHANLAKEYARTINPGLAWLDQALVARANVNDVCNAFYDPQDDTVNFFRAGAVGGFNCGNTGRLPDVIYHEFGHALHANSLQPGLPFDGALSEGVGDYYAATITGDPAMGVGFTGTADPLRHIDPPGVEASWPADIDPDVHITGLIFAGAMWDLRKELVGALGQEAGVALADQLFYAAVQYAPDIPGSYPAVLAEDDDDGNLANGTPHSCLIDAAFGLHGLATGEGSSSVTIDRITAAGQEVSFRVLPPANTLCPVIDVSGATLDWRLRDNPAMSGSLPMVAAGDTYAAVVPFVGEPQVVEYRVAVQFQNGATTYYPDNQADPMYQMFVGGVVEIYCTDFESDPFAQGWTSGSSAGVNDWAWGTPAGSGTDPGAAYSGTSVLGNNLAGSYSSTSLNYIDSPPIDVSGYSNVRLQYRRWLYVEDGYWDHATIQANGTQVWANADSMAGDVSDTHHTDREWRFHDVDITDTVQSGTVQIRYQLESDQALEFGGWTIDNFCVVSYVPTVCGDGQATSLEECDNGTANSDTQPDACRTDCVAAYCGDGVLDSQEQCDDGNNIDGDACSNLCAGINEPLTGGCCDSGRLPSGTPLLVIMTLLGIALRRRSTIRPVPVRASRSTA